MKLNFIFYEKTFSLNEKLCYNEAEVILMLNELIQRKKLTPQEESIVHYINEHPECVIHHNAKELAKLMYVSSPTIIRFVKKLGFKGYSDFQITYIQEYMMFHSSKDRYIDEHSSIQDIIDILPDIYNHVFMETKKLTKKDAFIRTINYMAQAKQIDFYANDNNYAEVQSACLKLSTLGIRAQAFNTMNTAYLDAIEPSHTLAFVVSHSGNNQTMVDAAYALRKKRIRVIGITGKLSPTLELICNENLYIDSYSHHLPFSIMLYGLSIHYIIDVLIVSLSLKKTKK